MSRKTVVVDMDKLILHFLVEHKLEDFFYFYFYQLVSHEHAPYL